MKNFTRLIFVYALGALSFGAIAQDMGVSQMTPADGAEIEKGQSFRIGVVLTNYGSTEIAANTQVGLRILLQGANNPISLNLTLNQAIAAGASTPQLTLQQAITFNDNAATGDFEICAWSELSGDIDNSNDTTCNVLKVIERKQRDFALTSFISPTASTVLETNTTTDLTFTLQNAGTIEAPVGTTIPLTIVLGNSSPQNANLTLSNAMAAGASLNVSITDYSIPAIEKGDQELCVTVNFGNDPDATNNQLCQSYEVDYATGIQQKIENSSVQVYPNPAADQVNFTYALSKSGNVSISISNMNGQIVKEVISQEQNAGNQIVNANVSELPNGTYIYQVKTENDVKTGQIIIAR